MTIAATLERYLSDQRVDYELLEHPATPSASRTAQAAHVTGERVAKGVVLHDDQGYLLAVVPATHRIEVDTIQGLLNRRLALADEDEIARVFTDCAVGAVPAVGAAYGVEVLMDESLADQPEVYVEAGDHTNLVRMDGAHFEKLMADARRARFSHHVA